MAPFGVLEALAGALEVALEAAPEVDEPVPLLPLAPLPCSEAI